MAVNLAPQNPAQHRKMGERPRYGDARQWKRGHKRPVCMESVKGITQIHAPSILGRCELRHSRQSPQLDRHPQPYTQRPTTPISKPSARSV